MEVESNLSVVQQKRQQVASPVPSSAPLSFSSFMGGCQDDQNILESEKVVYLTSGRMAIAQALILNNIGSGDEVLVPAYHCSSMVAPISYSGAKVVFYRILENMEIDLDDIARKSSHNTRLLLVAHYFGFPQPIRQIRNFCEDRRILLLEDCAHALFSHFENTPLGSFGDYAAGSLMKFFPVNDGGFLVANGNNPLNLSTTPGGRNFELRTILNTIEKSFIYNRLYILSLLLWLPLKVKNLIWRWLKTQRNGLEVASTPAASDGGFDFEPKWINTRISYFSKMICSMVSTSRIVDRRISNYHWLLKAFEDTPHIKPLFSELPEGVTPYIFPVIIDPVDPAFLNLRNSGIPLLRWEYLDPVVNEELCKYSSYYSCHLVQIPCHQELSIDELKRMTDSIKKELSQHNP